MNEKSILKEEVIYAIKKLSLKNLALENIIEYIDYKSKVRYSEKEIIECLIFLLKEKLKDG